jgi:hypothetical protein
MHGVPRGTVSETRKHGYVYPCLRLGMRLSGLGTRYRDALFMRVRLYAYVTESIPSGV